MKRVLWVFIVILAILVGLIPLTYLLDQKQGFLEMKDPALLKSMAWNIGFYSHIFSGGVAITIGWLQFSKKLIRKRPVWHRTIGKVYVVTGLLCSFAGIFIGFYATGGIVAQLGFSTGGLIFFYTTLMGYLHARNGQIAQHQNMMTYSYAMCLGAITLRLYMTLLMLYLNDYLTTYIIISWLSWIPNLAIAHYLNQTAERLPQPIRMAP